MRYNLIIDVSTHCNARCPQCSRIERNGLKTVDNLPLTHWTYKMFADVYSGDIMNHIKHFNFNATWGDALMNPDIRSMVKYILSVTPDDCIIKVVTNGSMRDPLWWYEFGLLSGLTDKLEVCFDIDGINQEMHSKYRRGTNLDKVLENMSAIAETHAKITSQSIVFKHNEPYLLEIDNLAKQNGSSEHVFIFSNRFKHNMNEFKFVNENGIDEILEKTENNHTLKPINYDNTTFSIETHKQAVETDVMNFKINYDGNVHTCCFLGSHHFNTAYSVDDWNYEWLTKDDSNTMIENYMKNKSKFNCFENDLAICFQNLIDQNIFVESCLLKCPMHNKKN